MTSKVVVETIYLNVLFNLYWGLMVIPITKAEQGREPSGSFVLKGYGFVVAVEYGSVNFFETVIEAPGPVVVE